MDRDPAGAEVDLDRQRGQPRQVVLAERLVLDEPLRRHRAHRVLVVGVGAPLRLVAGPAHVLLVVVAHHALGAELAHPAHHADRIRPAIDEIAEEHQAVAGADRPEQLVELLEATVDVADHDRGHGVILS